MGDPCRGNGARDVGDREVLKKWSCNACTYENWPRAVRCAMCQLTKDFNPKGSRNIYELAFVNHDLNPHNKWSCNACTYLNWPKAVRCTQCQRNRSSSPPSSHQSTPFVVHSQKSQSVSSTNGENENSRPKNENLRPKNENSRPKNENSRPNSATGGNMGRAEAGAKCENTTFPLMIPPMIPPWSRTSSIPTTISSGGEIGSDHHSSNNLPQRDRAGDKGAIEKKKNWKGKSTVRSTPSPPPSLPISAQSSSPSDSPGLDSYFNRININSTNSSSTTNTNSSSTTNTNSSSTTCTKSTLKWPCTICTFENWPKANKCSMCCTPRGNH